jgi:predicted Zn-dependent protease
LQGKLEESLAEIKRAQQLDPLSLVINLNVAEVLLYMQKDDLAIEQLKKTLELDPNFPGAHTALGSAYAEQRNYTDAIRELQTVRQIVGPNDPTALGMLGFVYAKAGRTNDANEMLKKVLEFTKGGYALAVPVATVYVALGDNDKVFEWLQKGYDEQNVGIGYLKISPVWNNVRSDPRYTALLKKIGLQK